MRYQLTHAGRHLLDRRQFLQHGGTGLGLAITKRLAEIVLQGLQARVMEEQVIDWIAERAQATDVAMSFTDALRPNA